MKDDEQRLMLLLHSLRDAPYEKRYVRDLVQDLGIRNKRACWILTKWNKKRWYEWGVNILAGWLTPEGHEVAEKEQENPDA